MGRESRRLYFWRTKNAGAVDERTEYLETLGCCQGFTQVDKCDVTAGYPLCTMGCLTIFWTTSQVCGAT